MKAEFGPTMEECMKEACRLLVGLAKYNKDGDLVGFCQDSGEVYNYIVESLAERKELQTNEAK